jgi:hypothetical protein
MAVTGWYVLYRDGPGHSIRATDGFDSAIGTAWQLRRDGRNVIQVGPRDKRRSDEVIGANEIKRICALMEETILIDGHSTADIARDLKVSAAIIKTAIHEIIRKLTAKSAGDAV